MALLYYKIMHRISFLAIFLFLFSLNVNSQNLVKNPGFEFNAEITQPNKSNISGHFKYIIGWNIIGWQTYYCHCELPHDNNWFFSSCKDKLYSPHTGCGMVKMIYEESCNNEFTSEVNRKLKGCTSYLESELIEPLKVGQVYEISFWVYFPEDTLVEKSILNNIGFLPMLKKTTMTPHNMLNVNGFFNHPIQQGQWFQIKYFIRALCPLRFIIIGAFRNESFPIIHRTYFDHYPFYFVDDVVVREINEENDSTIIPTAFCKFYENESKRLEHALGRELTLNFNTNEYELTNEHKDLVDSFILDVESKWRPVYSVIGHTDSIGSENIKLSLERAFSIRKLLIENYKIPEFRIVTFGGGSKFPLEKNNSPNSRAQNRRVNLKITSLTPDMGLYRSCLELTIKGDTIELSKQLKKWIRHVSYFQTIYLLFDVRFNEMKKYKFWRDIVLEVKNVYTTSYTSEDAFYLDSLRCEDQRYRTLERDVLILSGYFEQYENFDFNFYSKPVEELYRFDDQIVKEIASYLSIHPFPKISDIGRRNVEGIVNILIHSQDSNLIQKYIPVVNSLCLEGEAEWFSFAMLFDKFMRLTNQPQQYGTQFEYFGDKKVMKIAPLDDLNLVNQRRSKIGMAPIESIN